MHTVTTVTNKCGHSQTWKFLHHIGHRISTTKFFAVVSSSFHFICQQSQRGLSFLHFSFELVYMFLNTSNIFRLVLYFILKKTESINPIFIQYFCLYNFLHIFRTDYKVWQLPNTHKHVISFIYKEKVKCTFPQKLLSLYFNCNNSELVNYSPWLHCSMKFNIT